MSSVFMTIISYKKKYTFLQIFIHILLIRHLIPQLILIRQQQHNTTHYTHKHLVGDASF